MKATRATCRCDRWGCDVKVSKKKILQEKRRTHNVPGGFMAFAVCSQQLFTLFHNGIVMH